MDNFNLGKFLLLTLIVFLIPFCGYSKDAVNKYIGLKYRECPAGLIDEGGSVIDEKCNYGIHFYLKDSTHMLWLDKIYRDGSGRASYEVIDAIASPIRDKNYFFSHSCWINNEYQQFLVALVKNEEKDYYTDIKYAWRIDLRRGKFMKTSVIGIKCLNESMVAE